MLHNIMSYYILYLCYVRQCSWGQHGQPQYIPVRKLPPTYFKILHPYCMKMVFRVLFDNGLFRHLTDQKQTFEKSKMYICVSNVSFCTYLLFVKTP